MSMWNRIFGSSEAPVTSRDPSDDFWWGAIGHHSASGERVTVDVAREVPVVRDCLQILSDTIAGLAWGMFERVGDNETRRASGHPLANVLRRPNMETTDFLYWSELVDDLATVGNHYSEIKSGPNGPIDTLHRIEPDHVRVERLSDGTLRYHVRELGRPERVLFDDRIWHIARPPRKDRILGHSAIEQGREAIGSMIALQKYAARFFNNDAKPPIVFMHKGNFDSQQSRDNFLKAWARSVTGRNRHKPGVLEYGIDVKELAHTNEQAQFLETRKELALDIARLWRMPPHKVGIMDKATFSNIEQQALEFVVDTLTPWLELIEAAVNKDLVLNPDGFFFEFNVASLLRGDLKSRYEAYAMGRNWGWLSANEIRRLENMNPIGPGGDDYIVPLNTGVAGAPRDGQQQSAEKAKSFLRQSVAQAEKHKGGLKRVA